ncbi:hypothetical protein V1506DRAFT_535452 [Lipomyces tetrasporus]
MELLGNEDRTVIPSETDDGRDVAMTDDNADIIVVDEPSLPAAPHKKSASTSRSRPAKFATKRPKISSKIASPRSCSSTTSTPGLTTTTAETTFAEPDITPDRTNDVSKLVSTPQIWSGPTITGPRINRTDYVSGKRKLVG